MAHADVFIIGSGISGTLAARLLDRAGLTVGLIDRHSVYPPDFRAEHLEGQIIEQLRRLGFLEHLTVGLYRGVDVTIGSFGKVFGSAQTINYGLRYEDLVNRARAGLSPNIRTVIGRVCKIEASQTLQRIFLSDGRILTGRLIVLATGNGYQLCKQASITRRMIREHHSLTFGFNIERVDSSTFNQSFVVYQREQIQDKIDYLSAFTIGGTTRVNLFTYRNYREDWTKAFLRDPAAGLAQTLPGLEGVIGEYRTIGPVVARPTDLYVSEGVKRSGVVLIGDAFQAACPATGVGMVKLLTDIERLCIHHVPCWFKTPGMGPNKIAEFYDDPVKQACDLKALHDAEYRRSFSTDTSIGWHVHGARVRMMERAIAWRNRLDQSCNPRVNTLRKEPAPVPM